MLEWKEISRAVLADGSCLMLRERDGRFEIRVDGYELMGSRAHGSEEQMAMIGCAEIAANRQPCVLIGGLGMGYTLRACLNSLPATAHVCVAELVAEVIAWNQQYLGHLNQYPLQDPRVRVINQDVKQVWRDAAGKFDLILMDVDNGTSALTASSNDGLYTDEGLGLARRALKPGGLLVFWCADPDEAFVVRVQALNLHIWRQDIPALGVAGGPLHTLYFIREQNRSN